MHCLLVISWAHQVLESSILPSAVVGMGVNDNAVEDPHVDEVEELWEELNGERCVDSAPAQQSHGVGEDGQYLQQ